MTIDRPMLQRLFRYAVALTRDEDHAYGLVQHAVERYLSATGSAIASPPSWLRATIRNRFIDEHRRTQRYEHVPYEEGSVVDLGTQSLEHLVMTAQQLAVLWQQLDAEDREILYLWAVEGYSASEIASEWAVSRSMVLSRIHRLRKRLALAEGGAA
ncbi:MAG: sigma-70 family RNA polymerase sigma factor [Myxococcales bacterium]|nr:sigma-70 family RNA polymerase sigma factor [Myxococcales bacterium]